MHGPDVAALARVLVVLTPKRLVSLRPCRRSKLLRCSSESGGQVSSTHGNQEHINAAGERQSARAATRKGGMMCQEER